MRKIEDIEKLTNVKFLNLYKIHYNTDGKKHFYYVASRREAKDLECNNVHKTDAVRIIPYFRENDKIYVVLIKEFRHAINRYVYGTPAGLVDEGEDSKSAAIRELSEEIGAEVLSITNTVQTSYSSAGLTDETLECFEAEVKLNHKQHLDENEDIDIKLIELDKLPEFLKNNQFCLQSALSLRAFYYKMKYEQEVEKD